MGKCHSPMSMFAVPVYWWMCKTPLSTDAVTPSYRFCSPSIQVTSIVRKSTVIPFARLEQYHSVVTSVLGPWFLAAYHGSCAGCGDGIEPDDEIRADGEGGYLCADCGEEEFDE